MNKFYSLLPALILLVGCQTESTEPQAETQLDHRIPTQVVDAMANEKEYDERKKAYWNYIHGSDVNWKENMRAQHTQKYLERNEKRNLRAVETFADGQFEGEWLERGSDNQAGNVRITDFHRATDDIYAISDGGILWKGNLDGVTWTPLNDDIVFGRDVIKVTDLPGGDVRIIAAIGATLWYSDDDGANWAESSGISSVSNGGSGIDLVELNDAAGTIVYLCNRQTSPSNYRNAVYYSTDDGENWTHVTDLSTTNSNHASMAWHIDSDHAYILDSDEDTYVFDGTTLNPIAADLSIGGTSRMQIEASYMPGIEILYVLMDDSDLYGSIDSGQTFNYVSTLPTNAWGCGIGVSAEDATNIYYGEVELYRSTDGGMSFNKVYDWWEYYSDPSVYIHADIMDMSSYKRSDDTEFTLICNHGGINVSYDYCATTPNIGEADLNVGQLYDVITSPINTNFIYGGTQDQGFLRTSDGGSLAPSSFDQVISGDYGQMQLSNNGVTIWTQYPGADFAIYDNAMTDGGPTLWYDIGGSDMPNWNWIVPTGPAPYESDTYIFAGGGNVSGGSGSHLIKLDYTGGTVTPTQFDHDFVASSGQPISAIETTTLQPDFVYVSTGNGHFYRSENGGEDFTETESFLGPGSSWIYGADIYASKKTEGMVFLGGSAGAASSVFMSLDSGKTFTPLGGLPSTMVHEMVMDPAEKFLFAATDAGPYVYSMDTEEWYDILGLAAPVQQYMTVEFVEAEHIVRFATWGRGIWDLQLTVTTGVEEIVEEKPELIIYPNPATEYIKVNVNSISKLQLHDMNGKVVLESGLTEGENTINLPSIPDGIYVVKIGDVFGKVSSQTLIVRNQ